MVDSVGSASSPTPTSLYATPETSAPDQTLDTQDFMNLLIAQLQNQDPTQPMDSSEMVQQTTELGMMQELTQVQSDTDSSLTLQMQSTAASLLGQNVIYTNSSGVPATGIATAVSFSGSSPTVTIGGQSVALSAILGITQAAGAGSSGSGSGSSGSGSGSSGSGSS
jgi:flagellar basal-body rod modification protein FlgD